MEKRQLDIYNKIREDVKTRGKKVEFFSYSKIDTYLQCNLQYKFKYIDKIKSEFKDNIYTDMGTLLHTLTEKYIGDVTIDKSYVINEYESQAVSFLKSYGLDTSHSLYISLQHFINNSEFLESKKHMKIKKQFEVPIYMRLKATEEKEYWFVGFIDMVEEDEDGNVIMYDFKTSHRSSYTGKKLNKSCIQLYVYAYIYQLLYNKKINSIKYLFMKFCDITFKDSKNKIRKSSNIERCKLQEEFIYKGGVGDLMIKDNFIDLDASQDIIKKYMLIYINNFIKVLKDKNFGIEGKDEGYCVKLCEYRKSGHCTRCDEVEQVQQPMLAMLNILKKPIDKIV